MKGTVHNIHILENRWIFKTMVQMGKDLIPQRYPFMLEDKTYSEGQEIIGTVIFKDGVEFIKEKI